MSSFGSDFSDELIELVEQFEALASQAKIEIPNYSSICRSGLR